MDARFAFDDRKNLHNKIWGNDPAERIDRVKRLSKVIRPVIRFSGLFFKESAIEGSLHYVRVADIFRQRFLRDPIPGKRACGLASGGVFTSFHTLGFELYFAPSIAEVLAQIPAVKADRAHAFEVIDWPRTWDDVRKQPSFADGLHAASVQIYYLI